MRYLLIWINIFVFVHGHAAVYSLPIATGAPSNSNPYPQAVTGKGIPNQGYLDSFHRSIGEWPWPEINIGEECPEWLAGSGWFPCSGWGSKELNITAQAMRLTKVQELLRARKAYLEMMDPEAEYAPKRIVPREVERIFVHPDGSKIMQIQTLLGQLQREGVVRSKEERRENRRKVFETFNVLAISLSQMDRLIRFFDHEIFEDNPSFERMVKNMVREREDLKRRSYWSGREIDTYEGRARRELKSKLRKQLKLAEVMENILAYRTHMLDRHPLLGVELSHHDCILYQCLYNSLQEGLHLPDLRGKMRDPTIDFTTAREVGLKETDQKQAQRNLQLLSEHQHGAYTLSAPIYDEAIEIALEGNYNFLQELCSQRRFADNQEPYLVMALDARAWERLVDGRFIWIDSEVFAKGKREIEAIIKARGDWEHLVAKTLEYASWSLIGIAGLTFLSGFGPLAMPVAQSLALKAFVLSGVTYGIKFTLGHINHKRYGELARNLYVATNQQSYYGIQEDYRLIVKREYQEAAYVLGQAVFFGGRFVKPIKALFKKVHDVGEKTLALSRQRVRQMSSKLKSAKDSVLMKFAHFRRLLGKSSAILNNRSLYNKVAGPTKLLKHNAAKLGISAVEIRNKIKGNPLVKKALDKIVGPLKVVRGSRFVRRELTVEFVAALGSEVVLRGDKFFEEFDYVMLNMLFSMGIVYNISAQTFRNSLAGVTTSRVPSIFPRNGGPVKFNKRLWNSYKANAKQLGKPSLALAATLNAGLLALCLMRGDELDEKDVLKGLEAVFWMTAFTALTSPVRSRRWRCGPIGPLINFIWQDFPRFISANSTSGRRFPK